MNVIQSWRYNVPNDHCLVASVFDSKEFVSFSSSAAQRLLQSKTSTSCCVEIWTNMKDCQNILTLATSWSATVSSRPCIVFTQWGRLVWQQRLLSFMSSAKHFPQLFALPCTNLRSFFPTLTGLSAIFESSTKTHTFDVLDNLTRNFQDRFFFASLSPHALQFVTL